MMRCDMMCKWYDIMWVIYNVWLIILTWTQVQECDVFKEYKNTTILIVLNDISIGGATNAMMNLIDRMIPCGIKITVWTHSRGTVGM